MQQWWEIRLHVPHEAAEAVSAVLLEWPEVKGVALEGGERLCAPHPEFGEWMDERLHGAKVTLVSFYVPDHVAEASLRARVAAVLQTVRDAGLAIGRAEAEAEFRLLDESSWESAWKEDFRPTRSGQKLMIVPKWWLETVDLEGRQPIVLDPGMAFGTGTHPTTQLCLEALEGVVTAGQSVLDIGCGTAVLGIGAVRLGARPVWAIDIDPLAVRTARDNVADNGLEDQIAVMQGDLLAVAADRQFDGAIANILRDIVIRLLPQAKEVIRPGGWLVTSGFVTSQEEAVATALTATGFDIVDRAEREDWVVLVGRRPL